MKTVSSTLSSLPVEGQGLLIAAADPNTSTACLVGTVPVASDGSFADAAGKEVGRVWIWTWIFLGRRDRKGVEECRAALYWWV